MLTFNFRFGDVRVPCQPVRDLYVRIGRHFYLHQITRRPGGLIVCIPGFCLTFTRIL